MCPIKYTTHSYAQYFDRRALTFTRPIYHIATADCYRKIDLESFIHLVAHIAKNGNWSEDAMAFWSVLRDGEICSAVNDMQVEARAWINSQIQAWKKNVSISTKRANVKGDDGNIVPQLIRPESQLKEFPGTSFRSRERSRH